jgi:hypothetical protein
MRPNAFIGKKEPPSNTELAKVLGASNKLWSELLSQLRPDLPDQEWSSYSPKAGWALKLKKEERNILYLSPCNGCFRASFALSDKAVQAARKSQLPKSVHKIIAEAKKYAEGRAVRLEVKSAEDIAAVHQLALIKVAH